MVPDWWLARLAGFRSFVPLMLAMLLPLRTVCKTNSVSLTVARGEPQASSLRDGTSARDPQMAST